MWALLHREVIVDEVRARLRDPAIMVQSPTDFCGPLALLLEFIRRSPAEYVRAVDRLLGLGTLIVRLRSFEAADDLRGARPVLRSPGIGEVDWMLAATLRDAENIIEDVDDGEGWEALTVPGEMEQWTRDFLGLEAEYFACMVTDELEAMMLARDVVDAGGVAFLLIDKFLIKDGGTDHEEGVFWRSRPHFARMPVGPFPATVTHSRDDRIPPDHWVVYLGGLGPGEIHPHTGVAITLWSWGQEFEVIGQAEAVGEYLYGVVVGRPGP